MTAFDVVFVDVVMMMVVVVGGCWTARSVWPRRTMGTLGENGERGPMGEKGNIGVTVSQGAQLNSHRSRQYCCNTFGIINEEDLI